MTFRGVFTVLFGVLVAVVRFGSAFHSIHLSQQRVLKAGCLRMNHDGIMKKFVHSLATGFLAFNVMTSAVAHAEVSIPNVPVYNKKSSDLIPYVNVERGFKLFRPFGWNEFEGQGGGYAVKFARYDSSTYLPVPALCDTLLCFMSRGSSNYE